MYKLTKTHVKIKNPYIREEALQRIMRDKLTGTLEEEEWKRIISSIFNESDSLMLHEKIHEVIFRTSVQ